MHMVQPTPLRTPSTPAWVSDWWIPATGLDAAGERRAVDLPAEPAVEPPPAINVMGRPIPQLDLVQR
jgi:hypothetical protein